MIEERLLTRIGAQVDLIKKEGFPCFSGSYSYPFKKSNIRIEVRLSKAFQKEEKAFVEKFYQEVKISIPPNLKDKTLKDIETIKKNLRNFLKKNGFEAKHILDEGLLTRIGAQVDLIKKEGFSCFSGSYSYPFKKGNLRIEIHLSKRMEVFLSKAFQKQERISDEKFYQEVKISIPQNTDEKTLNQIDKLRESLVIYLRKAGFETKN